MPRMIKTPWSDDEIPFEKAAEIGTKKVIEEHSTIGILVTTDGSITDISRDDYIKAEERVVAELQSLNKPFVILLNSSNPYSDYAKELSVTLSEKYNSTVIPVNCENLTIENINEMFSKLLYEFPIEQICINFPKWIDGLDFDNKLKTDLYSEIQSCFYEMNVLKQVSSCKDSFQNSEIINSINIDNIELGTRQC